MFSTFAEFSFLSHYWWLFSSAVDEVARLPLSWKISDFGKTEYWPVFELAKVISAKNKMVDSI